MPARNVLQIVINADDNASDILKNVVGGIQGIGDAALQIAGAALVGATTAVVGFGVASLNTFSDFQQGINEVFTLLPGITEQAMSEMEASVQRFDEKTGRVTEETIPALYQALSASVPKENVFAFLETANKAAIGGATDLVTAVNGITSAVNAYGPEVLNAAQASDVMFTAVRLGKTTFEELSASMFQVTTVAAGMDVAFGDVLAGVATLTSQGVPTSVAMTQIRQALLEINDPATEIGKKFQELAGVSLPDFIASGHNLADVFALLEEEANRAGIPIEQMFGSVEAGQAALALTGANMDTFTNNITEMGNAAGATDAAFNTMNQGIGMAMNRLGARWESLLISMGRVIEPFITPLVDIFSTILAIASAMISGDFGALVALFESIPEPIRDIVYQLSSLGAWLIFVSNQFGEFIAAVSAGVDPLDAFQHFLYTIAGAGVAETFEDIVYWIGEITRVVGEVLQPVWDFIAANVMVQDVLMALGIAIASVVIPAIVGFFAAFIIPLGLLTAAIALLRTAWEDNWGGIQEKTAAVVDWITTTGWPALSGFFQNIADAWNNVIWPGISQLWDWFMVTGLPMIMDFIETEITPRWELFVSIMGAIWETVSGAFMSVFNWFMTDGLAAIMDFIDNEIIPRWDLFVGGLAAFWTMLEGGFTSFSNWFLVTGLPAVMDFIDNDVIPRWEYFQDLMAGIWDIVEPGFTALQNGATAVLDAILGGLQGAADAVTDFMNLFNGAATATATNPLVVPTYNSTGVTGGGGANGGLGSGGLGNNQFGGAVSAGVPTWVGEQGRELFVPSSDGQIVNNRDSEMMQSGKGSTQIIINVYGVIDDAQARESAYKLKRELQAQGMS